MMIIINGLDVHTKQDMDMEAGMGRRRKDFKLDFRNLIRRMQDYWSVIETRLGGLISKLKTVVACEEGIDIEKLLDYGVVLELDGIS